MAQHGADCLRLSRALLVDKHFGAHGNCCASDGLAARSSCTTATVVALHGIETQEKCHSRWHCQGIVRLLERQFVQSLSDSRLLLLLQRRTAAAPWVKRCRGRRNNCAGSSPLGTQALQLPRTGRVQCDARHCRTNNRKGQQGSQLLRRRLGMIQGLIFSAISLAYFSRTTNDLHTDIPYHHLQYHIRDTKGPSHLDCYPFDFLTWVPPDCYFNSRK